MRTRKTLLTTISAFACIGLPTTAMAQAGPVPGDEGEAGLAEIVVTAQRYEQPLQKTAASIAVLSGDELKDRAIGTIGDALVETPSVVVPANTKGAGVTIRGIGSTGDAQEGGDPAVSLSIDGIYMQQPVAVQGSGFDLSRVEVMRGPQGTLYGRNANAGSINFITNDPVLNQSSLDLRFQYGNYKGIRAEAAANVDLGEAAALRVAFVTNHRGSYYENGAATLNNYAGRVKLLLAPSDALKIRLTAAYSQELGAPVAGVPSPLDTSDPFNADFGPNPIYPNGVTIPSGTQNTRIFQLYGQIDYDLGIGTLSVIPSYVYTHQYTDYVILPIAGGVGDVVEKAYSGELRVASNPESAIKWVAGLYYYNSDDQQDIFAVSRLHFLSFPPSPGATRVGSVARSYAAFGQVTVPVTEQLRLTAGARYTHDRKGFDFINVTSPTGGTPLPSVYQSFNSATYKAGFEFDVAARSMLYGQVSSGFKAGGVNNDGTSYDPEKITAYELGLKNRFLDNKIQLNLSGFYYDYTGFQVREASPCVQGTLGCTPSGILFLNRNATSAKVYGGEFELVFAPTDNSRFYANVSYLHSRFGTFTYTGRDLSGTRLPNAPTWSGSVGYSQSWDVGSGKIEARGDLRFSGGYDTGIDPGIDDIQGKYTKSDASLGYTAAEDRWGLRLFVRNIENNIQRTYSLDPPVPGTSALLVSEPRTYGVALSAKF